MIVVFTMNHNDAAMALRQAQWISSRGKNPDHEAIVACNKIAKGRGMDKPVVAELLKTFGSVESFTPYDEEESVQEAGIPHAAAANHMFKRVVQYIINFKGNRPFLWMETDATLVKGDGFYQIAEVVDKCGKPFVGDTVSLPNVTVHMSGIGVYSDMPVNAPEFVGLNKLAFDVALAEQIVPKMHSTRLIQHDWKPEPFKSREDLKRIRPGVVIYHQCKDGSLMDVLSGPEAQPISAESRVIPPQDAQLAALQERLIEVEQKLAELIATRGVYKRIASSATPRRRKSNEPREKMLARMEALRARRKKAA